MDRRGGAGRDQEDPAETERGGRGGPWGGAWVGRSRCGRGKGRSQEGPFEAVRRRGRGGEGRGVGRGRGGRGREGPSEAELRGGRGWPWGGRRARVPLPLRPSTPGRAQPAATCAPPLPAAPEPSAASLSPAGWLVAPEAGAFTSLRGAPSPRTERAPPGPAGEGLPAWSPSVSRRVERAEPGRMTSPAAAQNREIDCLSPEAQRLVRGKRFRNFLS